jgi:LAGLIDADG-like domain
MAHPKYPTEIKQQALDLLAAGKSSVEISRLLHIPATTICAWGYSKPTTKKIPEAEIAKIVLDYQSGLSLSALENQTGFNRKAISRLLKEQSIAVASYGARIQQVKHNPFADLTNPEVNYWLGLLAADGNITDAGQIKLSSVDLDILDKFQRFATCPKPKYEQGRVWTCGFMSKEVAAFLNSLGITPRKSLTLEVQIPLTVDFMRGYWDGNGSFSVKTKWGVAIEVSTGSLLFSKQLELFLEQHKIEFKTYIKKASTYKYKGEVRPTAAHYRVLVTKQVDALKLLKLMYNNPNPTIERKFAAVTKAITALLDKDIV